MEGHHFCFWSRMKKKKKKASKWLMVLPLFFLSGPFALRSGLFPNSPKPTGSCCSTCSVCCATLSSDQRRTKWIPKTWLSALHRLCYSSAASRWTWARSKRLDTCLLTLTHKAHKAQSVVCRSVTNRNVLVFTRPIFLCAQVWVWIVCAKRASKNKQENICTTFHFDRTTFELLAKDCVCWNAMLQYISTQMF